MPYRKTRRAYRKRPAKKSGANYTRQIARAEAKKVVAKSIETKMFDHSAAAQAVDWNTGVVASVTTGIGRGTGEGDYIGDKITPCGLSVRLQLTRADATQLIRILVIQNKAGGIPLLSTLLQSVANATAPLSPLDNDYENTYRVLYDKTWSMDSVRGTSTQARITIPRHKFRSLVFNDQFGTIEKGGIYLCAISDSGAAAHPVLDYRMRFYYRDA